MKIAITFDVDMVDHYGKGDLDEFQAGFGFLKKCLKEFPFIKTSWFIRIDSQISASFGSPTYIFEKHVKEIDWLKENGHEIGWHHHGYILEDGFWRQNRRESMLCEELKLYGNIAIDLGLQSARMGWGYHTNATMSILDQLGFKIDSSAIPRPNYQWDLSVKDWSITGQNNYKPSINDYRTPGSPEFNIWEIPITTTVIPVPTDTDSNVIRYINQAYKTDIFRDAVLNVSNPAHIVTISHLNEILNKKEQHPLISFDLKALYKNFELLCELGYQFSPLSEMLY
jgi:hypothetical protein